MVSTFDNIDCIDHLFINKALHEAPQLVDLFNQDVELFRILRRDVYQLMRPLADFLAVLQVHKFLLQQTNLALNPE
jgi:recombinational DNA repair protein (RecF pathway)